MIPRLSIGGSELLAVPAVHNRAVFAEQVNRVCHDEATHPEAVAVELSHDAVTAVVAWMKELGVGPGDGAPIPCMLGLVKVNRRIHPRYREATVRLQERFGLPLHRIPPEVLREQIGYSPVSLLCLSTTDSMIEAIRSAVELGLPVFGVDRGEVANAERGQPMILDPILAQGSLASYVHRNETHCVPHRDDVVDGRREQVMAARLRCLLSQYRRVLFTCGLGHWQLLRQRLLDPALKAAAAADHSEGERFHRVLVAPSLAIRNMDLFPDLTARYEALRRLPLDASDRLLNYAAHHRSRLLLAGEQIEAADREAMALLPAYLSNLCLIEQRRAPDVFATLNAARAMVSPAFASRLGDLLVNKALDWAQPEDWPRLPYLQEVRSQTDARFPEAGLRAELLDQRGRSAPFFVSSARHEDSPTPELPLPAPGSEESDDNERSSYYPSWVWPPCESLLYGTAYQAAEFAERNRREPTPEPFAGSLHDGVDVKATLRAIIRGEKRVQVKVRTAPAAATGLGEGSDEPTVFIFERENLVTTGRWSTFLACEAADIRRFVRSKDRFNQIVQQRGDVFVACVHFGVTREPRAALRGRISDLQYLYGIVTFGNPCLNPRQAARWLESSDYTRCPILRWSGISNLFGHYQREFRMTLDGQRWVSSLIRLAFPYARERVTVVMPQAQAIPGPVCHEATARGLRLDRVTLDHFTPERIESIRHQYLVHPVNVDELKFSDELQAAFGESPLANLELLPRRIRQQIDDSPNPHAPS